MPKCTLITKEDRGNLLKSVGVRNSYSVERLARIAGVSERTMRRKLKDPESITIGELRAIDRKAPINDDELIYMIRKKWPDWARKDV